MLFPLLIASWSLELNSSLWLPILGAGQPPETWETPFVPLCIVVSPCAGPVVIQCTASNPLVLIDPVSRAQSFAPSGIAHLSSQESLFLAHTFY